jgi:hypothetical protein
MVPGVRIVQEDLVAIGINCQRPVLLECTQQGRATWSTIEPDEHGVRSLICTDRLDEHVVKRLVLGDIQIARPGLTVHRSVRGIRLIRVSGLQRS